MKLNHFQPHSFTQHPAECRGRQRLDTERWSSAGGHVLQRPLMRPRASWQFPLTFKMYRLCVAAKPLPEISPKKYSKGHTHREALCSVCGSYNRQLSYNYKRGHKLMAFARYKLLILISQSFSWSLFFSPKSSIFNDEVKALSEVGERFRGDKRRILKYFSCPGGVCRAETRGSKAPRWTVTEDVAWKLGWGRIKNLHESVCILLISKMELLKTYESGCAINPELQED